MDKNWAIPVYADEVGGVFSFADLEIIPFNHWKQDMEWLVLIIDTPHAGCFVPVRAHTVKEAITKAVYRYQNSEGDEDE